MATQHISSRRATIKHIKLVNHIPATVDELSFTARDERDFINWFAVPEPQTDYWHAHVEFGQACAQELLTLIHNPDRDDDLSDDTIAHIAMQIAQRGNHGLSYGFLSEISKQLIK